MWAISVPTFFWMVDHPKFQFRLYILKQTNLSLWADEPPCIGQNNRPSPSIFREYTHLVFVVVVPVPGCVDLLVDVVVVAVVLVPADAATVRGRARGRVGRRVAVTKIDII